MAYLLLFILATLTLPLLGEAAGRALRWPRAAPGSTGPWCGWCGYDLARLPAAACPECGRDRRAAARVRPFSGQVFWAALGGALLLHAPAVGLAAWELGPAAWVRWMAAMVVFNAVGAGWAVALMARRARPRTVVVCALAAAAPALTAEGVVLAQGARTGTFAALLYLVAPAATALVAWLALGVVVVGTFFRRAARGTGG